MNQYLLSNFNNNTLEYDLSQFNWGELVLTIVKEKFPSVNSLEFVHTALSPTEISEITLHVQNRFLDEEFSQMFDRFAEIYIKPLINNEEYLIKRQPTLNVVIPNQTKVGRRLPFHQGIFYDNGRGQGTVWMPLTKCYESNSMWVVDLDVSRKITKDVINFKWSVEQFEEECMKYAYPVTLDPGQAHLFNQEIIHGNINNETEITRMAIDWHVLIKNEEYHRRLPGGFFRRPGDYIYNLDINCKKSFICYIANNSNFDQHIPKYAQRSVIEKYLTKFGIRHNGWQFENEYLNHMPIFEHLLDQNIQAIVLFSMYSIPDRLINKALELNIELHFANEFMVLRSQADLDKILYYKNFAIEKKGKLLHE